MKSLVCLILLLVGHAMADITHFVSTSNVTIATPFTYTVSASHPLPSDFKPSFGVFELIKRDDQQIEGTFNANYTIQTFDINAKKIPSQSIQSLDGYGSINLAPIFIQMKSTLSPNQNQLNDIAPIIELFYINWLFIGAIICVLLIIMAIIIMRRKKQKYIIEDKKIKKKSPKESAMIELQKLEKALMDNALSIRSVYFKLTEVLCEFISDELKVNVLDATTVEMKRILKMTKAMKTKEFDQVMAIAHELDHYKFSEDPMFDAIRCNNMIQQIKSVIEAISNDI